ncbi:MAG: alpha/beta hydrolase [Pseudomonadota bacterium]|nr:alpha/beta hydrolase [Pseudomonadota bacterium]
MKLPKVLVAASRRRVRLLAGLGVVAGLAVLNALIARRSERGHAPNGSFVTVDGVRLHYTDRGQGSPIVLIHGNFVRGDDWDISGVAQRLLATSRVLIFDRPGYGYSERPRGRFWTATEQADLLHRALQQLNIERPLVVGHSFGAVVALALGLRYQNDIRGLVLLAGYYFWTLRPDALSSALTATPGVGDVFRYTFLPLLTFLQMPVLKWAMFSPVRITPQFEESYSSSMALRPSQLRASAVDGALMIPSVIKLSRSYKDLHLPLAVLAGDSDRIVFKRSSERLHTAVPGSLLKIIAGAGHMVHHAAPDEVSDVIQTMQDEVMQDEVMQDEVMQDEQMQDEERQRDGMAHWRIGEI